MIIIISEVQRKGSWRDYIDFGDEGVFYGGGGIEMVDFVFGYGQIRRVF